MNIPAEAPLHLLHRMPDGALSTHSRDPHGFPYPTALPFAPTASHTPMLLISHLAEHTRNLQADARGGFLVAHSVDGRVLEGQRLTLLGTFEMAPAEQQTELARRYLRYHPDAARYLELGDFSFWVMSVTRMRYIGGFGAMGWLGGEDIDPLEPISAADEFELCRFCDSDSRRPANLDVLGIDRYGCDIRTSGRTNGQDGSTRNRFTFDKPMISNDELRAALLDCFARQP